MKDEILQALRKSTRDTHDIIGMLLSVDLLERKFDGEGYAPCPLCNEPITHVEFTSGENNLFYIECKACKLKMETISKGEDNYTKEYLKSKWNRRNGRWAYEL